MFFIASIEIPRSEFSTGCDYNRDVKYSSSECWLRKRKCFFHPSKNTFIFFSVATKNNDNRFWIHSKHWKNSIIRSKFSRLQFADLSKSKRCKISKRIFLTFPPTEHANPLLPIGSFSPTIYRESSATAFDFTRGFRFTRTEKRRPLKSAKELAGSRRRLRRRYLNCRFCLLFPVFVGSQGSMVGYGSSEP